MNFGNLFCFLLVIVSAVLMVSLPVFAAINSIGLLCNENYCAFNANLISATILLLLAVIFLFAAFQVFVLEKRSVLDLER